MSSSLNASSSSSFNGTEQPEVRMTTTTTTSRDGCLLYSFIISTVTVGLLCLLGLVGNTVSFFVFYRDTVKTSTPFLFQGLSVIDNLLLVTVFPLYCIVPFVQYTNLCRHYLEYGYYIVLVYVFPLASVSQTATIWVTVLVGVNRYIAVCKPYQAARWCTVRQAKIQLGAVLVLSVLYNVPRFAESYIEYRPDGTLVPHHTELGDSFLYMLIYDNVLYMIFMLILPLLALTVLNIRLVRSLKELGRKRAEMQQSVRQQQDNNVTLVLVVVILVVIVCQTPALANRFMWSVLDEGARGCAGFQFYFSRLSNLLVIANSAVNFVVYFLFNARFRLVFGRDVCRCGGWDPVGGDRGGERGRRLQSVSTVRAGSRASVGLPNAMPTWSENCDQDNKFTDEGDS